jgi:DNA-binding transcriptional LysR family regulator
MLDRLTGMQVFARVAALGSLSAAARALGMSQTMATKHVAALEARLGTKLLHRTTRRLTLTEAGRHYLEAAERILDDVDEADAVVSADTLEVRGTLRVNVPLSFGIREIAPILPAFAKEHPALTVDLGLNDRQVDLMEEGWDLVVRIGNLKNSSMVARRLAPCHTIVCAAPSYLANKGTPRKIAELSGHNCLGYTLSSTLGVDRWLFGREKKITAPVSGNLKANNGDVLVAAAVAGQGIIYQPTFLVAREIADGLLVPIKLDHPTVALDGIFAAYLSERRPPAKIRAFIDYLVKLYRPVPRWDRGLSS